MKNLLYLGNALSQKGKTITTIETLSTLLKGEGYSVKVSSKVKNKALRLFDMLFSILRVRKCCDYVLIDTYSTQNFYYAYLSAKLCIYLKLKYIPILHGGNLPERLKRSPKKADLLFRNAYINVAPSNYTKEAFEAQGFDNLVCIPNSIEIKNYHFNKKYFTEIKLLWVRSFSKLYNPDLAITVLAQLQKKGLKASLCMVGPDNDGSLITAKEYAKSLNLNVEFTGKLSREDWLEKAKAFNIFINTTNFDNMPVSVIEAMAVGLPVISTNVGGMPHLILDNTDGILVPPNNTNAFFEAILKLKNDPNKANSIAMAARKKVEQFNWEIVKLQWESILK